MPCAVVRGRSCTPLLENTQQTNAEQSKLDGGVPPKVYGILYEAAAKALKEQGVKKLPDLYALKAEHKRLAEEKERLYEQYGEAKKRMQEYGIIKQNVDGILRVKPEKEWTQEL